MSINSNSNLAFKKLRELDAQFDAQLNNYRGTDSTKSVQKKSPFASPIRWIRGICLVAICLLLPFILLIRISLYTYFSYNLNGWFALGAGISASILLLMLYGAYLSVFLTGKVRLHRYIVRAIVLLVVSYCCYGMLYLSSVNAKTEQVRAHYRSLHPILRITVATATLASADFIITDLKRTRQQYVQMGLPPREQSLHYVQSTGYVHAVDLRTVGRAEWKNWLTGQLFNVLGYNTLRHVGTADHLHVSLPLND